MSERRSGLPSARQAAVARDVRVAAAFAEAAVAAPLGGVAGEAGEVAAEVRGAGGADRRFVAADGEAAGTRVLGPRPGVAEDVPPVAPHQPFVPDRGAVLADRVGGQRRPVEAHPAAHVAQVVVDPVVDLILHPDRGRLGHPGVLVGVVAHLQDVAVLVREGDLEVGERLGPRVLEGVVVVVEHEVAVHAARQAVPLLRLAAIGGRVAEQLLSQLLQVDVGLAVAAAAPPVGARLAPAQPAVLDRVHMGADFEHLLDEVGDAVAVAVAVFVGEAGRVDALGDPVDAEAAGAGRRLGRFGHRVGVARRVGVVGRPRLWLAEGPLVAGVCGRGQ